MLCVSTSVYCSAYRFVRPDEPILNQENISIDARNFHWNIV